MKGIVVLLALIGSGLSADAAGIAYWNLDEGTATSFGVDGNDFYMDQSGNGNDLATWAPDFAPTGSTNRPFTTVPQTGAPNIGSLHFDGVNDDLFNHFEKPISTNSFDAGWTVEASFKTDDSSAWGVIVGRDGDANGVTEGGAPPFSMKFRGTDQKLEIGFWNDDAGAVWFLQSSIALNQDEWYSAAATYDGTIAKLYIKGESDAAYVFVGQLFAAGGNLHPFDSLWTVGRGQWDGGNTDNFKGFIDEVRISDSALGTNDFLATSTYFPPPPIGDITLDILNANELSLTWATAEGNTYAIETKTDLLSGWSVSTNVPGEAGSVTFTTAVDQVQNFYRVTGE